jgi:tRNA A-37 threonylcarbamoyl transferase component Bud32
VARTLLPHGVQDERRGARREASLLSHLRHPNIIAHVASFEDEGYLYIVTEFAARGDLAHRLTERRGVWLAEDAVMSWLVQMGLALLYLHRRKVLHRDLKLANVFLTAEDDIKLVCGGRGRGRARGREGVVDLHAAARGPPSAGRLWHRPGAEAHHGVRQDGGEWHFGTLRHRGTLPFPPDSVRSARRTTSAPRSVRASRTTTRATFG